MRWLALLLACAALFGGSLQPVADAQAQEAEAKTLADRRARWQRMSPEERAELKARFERLKQLDPKGRRELERRADELRRREEHLREQDEFRSMFERRHGVSVEAADPERVRAESRRFRRMRDRERGGELRRHLPPEVHQRLESAPPEERRVLLDAFLRENRRAKEDRFLEKIGRRLKLSPEELAAIRATDGPVRHQRMRELHRRMIEEDVAEFGLGRVSPKDWAEARQLDTERFFERLRALDLPGNGRRGRRGGPGGGRGAGEGPPPGERPPHGEPGPPPGERRGPPGVDRPLPGGAPAPPAGGRSRGGANREHPRRDERSGPSA